MRKQRLFLSHLALYLEHIFCIVIWEVFSQEYTEDMKEFVYCPIHMRAIKVPPPNSTDSCNSSVASSDSANYTDECPTNFGVLDFLDPEVEATLF